MMQHVRDYYNYSQDKQWLSKTEYPLLQAIPQFWLSQRQQDRYFHDGTLVVNPCNSRKCDRSALMGLRTLTNMALSGTRPNNIRLHTLAAADAPSLSHIPPSSRHRIRPRPPLPPSTKPITQPTRQRPPHWLVEPNSRMETRPRH